MIKSTEGKKKEDYRPSHVLRVSCLGPATSIRHRGRQRDTQTCTGLADRPRGQFLKVNRKRRINQTLMVINNNDKRIADRVAFFLNGQ